MHNQFLSSDYVCPVCLSTDVSVFIGIVQVPIHSNLLWPTRKAAVDSPKGEIRLGFCPVCGHIYNYAFRPENMDYGGDYENPLHHSPTFRKYTTELASRLITRYDLYNRDIIDIGCGDGYFLRLLCKLGSNRGIGFDPSLPPDLVRNSHDKQVTLIRDFYSKRYANHNVDFFCCRHVLEHIPSPRDFLSKLRLAVGNRPCVVFFEVPNAIFTLRDLGIWDLIYEHCSYFTITSLEHLFASSGFQIADIHETFDGQFLCIEASTTGKHSDAKYEHGRALQQATHYVDTFAESYHTKIKWWRLELQRIKDSGKNAAVWGAGSKGVTFLNILKIKDQIRLVIDINPRKHGKYVAGTGQKIVSPEVLKRNSPDNIIVMNPIYLEEIRQTVEAMAVSTSFLTV